MKRSIIGPLLLTGVFIIVITLVVWAYSGNDSTSAPVVTPTVTTPAPTPIDEYTDSDRDGISDYLEVTVLGTDPLTADTDGDGINDYNELFIYPDYLDPLNASDAQPFIDMIPNVIAQYPTWETGGRSNNNMYRMVNYSMNDPLVQWYAQRTSISWRGDEGELEINGTPFFKEPSYLPELPSDAIIPPSWYFTHGEKGYCGVFADAAYIVMQIQGYECRRIYGKLSGEDHG